MLLIPFLRLCSSGALFINYQYNNTDLFSVVLKPGGLKRSNVLLHFKNITEMLVLKYLLTLP